MAMCEKCVGDQCYQAPCNLDCRHYGTWCETWVLGGGDGAFDKSAYEMLGVKAGFAEFLCQRVMVVNERLRKAGIEVGDLITHVGGMFADNVESFGRLIRTIPPQTPLGIMKPDGTRLTVNA